MSIKKFSFAALTFLASLVQTRAVSCNEAIKYTCLDTSDLDASGKPKLYTCAIVDTVGSDNVMEGRLLCRDMGMAELLFKSVFLDQCVYITNQFFALGWASKEDYIAAFPDHNHMIFGRHGLGNSYLHGSHESTDNILSCNTVTLCKAVDVQRPDQAEDENIEVAHFTVGDVSEFFSVASVGRSMLNGLGLSTVEVSRRNPSMAA